GAGLDFPALHFSIVTSRSLVNQHFLLGCNPAKVAGVSYWRYLSSRDTYHNFIIRSPRQAKPFHDRTLAVTGRASYRAVGVAMAIAGVVCFSLRPILIKLAYGYVVDPITLLALRMIFSLPFFLAAAAWVGRDATRNRLTRRDVWAI